MSDVMMPIAFSRGMTRRLRPPAATGTDRAQSAGVAVPASCSRPIHLIEGKPPQPHTSRQKDLTSYLAFYYLDRDPDGPAARTRTVICTEDETGQVSFEASPAEPPAWNDPEFIQQMPRALLFIDLPAGT